MVKIVKIPRDKTRVEHILTDSFIFGNKLECKPNLGISWKTAIGNLDIPYQYAVRVHDDWVIEVLINLLHSNSCYKVIVKLSEYFNTDYIQYGSLRVVITSADDDGVVAELSILSDTRSGAEVVREQYHNVVQVPAW